MKDFGLQFSEWTWLGMLGVGLTIGFSLGRWASRREDDGRLPWHGLPLALVRGLQNYMAAIFMLVSVGIGVSIIQAVFFPAEHSASGKATGRLPG